MPLRPPVGQMLASQVEKSSITSGPHGPPADELLLLAVELLLAVAPLLVVEPLLVVAPLLVVEPLLVIEPLLVVEPLLAFELLLVFDPPAPVLEVVVDPPDPPGLMQTESTQERPALHMLPDAHGHLSSPGLHGELLPASQLVAIAVVIPETRSIRIEAARRR
jgi:hypothetical protein